MQLVNFENIFKSYPGKEVLKGVSFSINKGTIHGFLGPNGAGKSTLMNILLGEIELDSGSVDISKDVSIGYLPEVLPLYQDMKAGHYLDFVQTIYGKKDKDFLDEVINKCGIRDYLTKQISHLSKGYKQRVALAGCICHNPQLIVLDEPLVGLDPNAMVQMKELIKSLAKDHTIFVSSHQLHELSQVCDMVTIMNGGEIISSGPIEEVTNIFTQAKRIELEFVETEVRQAQDLLESNDYEVSVNGTKLIVNKNTSEDLKLVIAKLLKSSDLTVLSQRELKMDLEEVFKTATMSKEERS